MKKIFIYFFAFLFICFIFPALLTKREKETSSEVNNIEINDTSKVEENVQSQYEYKKYGTIKQIKRNAKKYINIFFIFSPSYSLIYELSFNFMLFKILRSILDTCT